MLGADAQEGTKLASQELWVLEQEPDATFGQRRIARDGQREIGELFVSP